MPEPAYNPVWDHVLVPAPAAGAEWSFVNDRGQRLLVRYVTFRLVTSVAVANRVVTVVAKRDVDVWARQPTAAVQAASLTRLYSAYPGSLPGADSAGAVTIGWPDDGLLLEPGYTLGSVSTLLDAADQYSQVILTGYRLDEDYPRNLEPMPPLFEHNLGGVSDGPVVRVGPGY